MLAPPGNLRPKSIYSNCSACKIKFFAPLAVFQGTRLCEMCMWLFMFIIMKMKMYSILDKAKPHTENIKGLHFGGGYLYDHSNV
jgi:hypothetical protein